MPLFHRYKNRGDDPNIKSRKARFVEKYHSLVEEHNSSNSRNIETEGVLADDKEKEREDVTDNEEEDVTDDEEEDVTDNEEEENYTISECNGTKKALLIGINYTDTSAELSGCINDAKALKQFLIDEYDYPESNIRLLTDDGDDEASSPTVQNIVDGMKWLVNNAKPNDSYFFSYSGHGTRVTDDSEDEPDGFDEAICPLDYKEKGVLIDDDMHALLVAPLPAGARLTALFDSCHSGTALDLPYIYSTDGELKKTNIVKHISRSILSAAHTYYIEQKRENAKNMMRQLSHDLLDIRHIEKNSREHLASPADVIMISGCKDNQFSADIAAEEHGAMTCAFLEAFRDNPTQTYQELLVQLRKSCEGLGIRQRPQLSASHPIDLDVPFIC